VTAGEAWTREVLRELRARRYTPHAWVSFLRASFTHARASRAEHAREHRQTLLVGAVGIVAWSAVFAFQPWLAAAGMLWWLLVIAMVDWHLGMIEDDAGRPLGKLGTPNLLSIARAAVIPALVVAPPGVFAALLIAAGVTDVIDGPLARARAEETRLGVWLDGGVDAIVLSAATIGAASHALLPWWAAALVLGRHTLQWVVVTLAYFIRAAAPPRSGVVSGKVPGLTLFAGLALAALQLPGATVLVTLGALGGLTTFSLTLARARRLQPAG